MYDMGSITNSDGGVPPVRIIAIDFRQDNWIRKVQIKFRKDWDRLIQVLDRVH